MSTPHTRKIKDTKKKTRKNVASVNCDKYIQRYNRFETTNLVNKNYQERIIKLLNTPYSPKNVKPSNDYYSYINYLWLQEAAKNETKMSKKEKYFVQIDDYRLTQDKVYIQLFDIIKEYIANNKSKQAKCIRNVYLSLLNLDSIPLKRHIQDKIMDIDNYIKMNDLWKFMAYINKVEIVSFGCPVYWSVSADQKNSKFYTNYINSPEFTLYDLNLYLPDAGQTKEFIQYKHGVVKEYFIYINKLFDATMPKNHGLKAQDVFDVEYDIFMSYGCSDIKKDDDNGYNVVKADEALEKYGFDWNNFAHHLGYKDVPKTFICSGLNYLKCVSKLLVDNWNSPKWKTYWYYIFLKQMIRFDSKLIDVYYSFNGKFIKGQPEPMPKELYPIFGLSYTFNTFLTEEYVSKYKNDVAVKFVEDLGYDLITVFKRIVGRNTWMSEKTKKAALQKLDHLKLVVARPEKLREDPLLEYTEDDAWGNMMLITNWKREKFLQLSGREVIDIPVIDWNSFSLSGYQAYIVNAFYTPVMNSIYIPLAYIQKPFVDLEERGIEHELAHIGYVLGHEMSHSLDSLGSKYDYKGDLHDWWTPEDKRKYKLIIKDIIKQYETFAAYDGIHFDATIGVGEDMADISGLHIVTEYLADFQDKNQDIIPIRSLSFQALYVYFAMQYREHIYKQAIQAQLKTNPHPLDKYRTNIPLSRLKVFRSLYNVKKGDKMWWHSTSTIW